MTEEAGQHVVSVLPDGFENDHRGLGWDLTEDVDTIALAVDEAVLLFGLERMGAFYLSSKALDSLDEIFLSRLLRGPAYLVGGQAQVTTGDQGNWTRHLRSLIPKVGAVYNGQQLLFK
jgi:hypothetical protein